MKKTLFILMLASMLALTIYSGCKKDEVVGPPGPAGATGATGATGNANVIIITDTVSSLVWTNYGSSSNNWLTSITVPQITQAIVDSGAVFVYLYDISGSLQNGWVMLPFTFYQGNSYNWDSYYYLNTELFYSRLRNMAAIQFQQIYSELLI